MTKLGAARFRTSLSFSARSFASASFRAFSSFSARSHRKANRSRYLIDTKTRLSIAIRFFAGADPCDVMQVHDVSLTSVYYTVWGVIEAINACDYLRYKFPNHEEQKEIARGFGLKSGAGFKKVIGAIDGLVICILLPCLSICRSLECGQVNFRCHWKDKYGLNLQATCDLCLKFI